MHLDPNAGRPDLKNQQYQPSGKQLDFLWLELTNRCNLQCVHCYTDSHPHSGDRDLLTTKDYISLMEQAFALGCRKLQFIGGEPQLNADFLPLLKRAKAIGFEFVEVFTNLTRLDDETISFSASHGVCFATSVYSDEPAAHDAITKVSSSHFRTIANLKKLIGAGIETRAATIVMDQDKASVGRTKRFLRDLGVKHVNHGETREFGRGEEVLGESAKLSGLCGHCWAGKLCIAPDGEAYPCVMARQWPVGNVLRSSLGDIVRDRALGDMRQTIFDTVWLPKLSAQPNPCPPGPPECGPDTGAPDCAPELTSPPEKIPAEYEPGKGEPDDPVPQCFPCPQSCGPDFKEPPCNPNPCPQSCGPFQTV